ncbi:MAG: ABC transporter ATP-binding protein [Chloroflexi bacterium]|nr:ABC transporter ATP-binding protein [Chloroflexota bacterium]
MVQKNETPDKGATPVVDSSNGALLSIQNLHVWFELKRWGFAHAGYVRAVDGVSFDLARGDAIAIVGESGSGKTSLMKTILGLNRPIKGDIIFDGQKFSELSPREIREYRSKIGFVQQDPYGALPPFMSVQRILAEPLVINGFKDPAEREERIRRVMDEVKLNPVDDFIDKFPHMLSGGQQQRVVIARAMILEPKLIVADEPVSMLDASVRVEILKLLENLQQTHDLAVIYITHDLSTVRYFSERIFVMYAGKLIEKSEVDGILYNHLHPYTDALLQGTSEPDAANAHKFKEVPPGEPPSLVNPPEGCCFHPRCPKIMDGLCNVEEPPEFEPSEPGHVTTCWLYSDKAKAYGAA